MNDKFIVSIITVIVLVIFHYCVIQPQCYDWTLLRSENYKYLVALYGIPNHSNHEMSVWTAESTDYYIKQIGIDNSGVTVWAPINLFAHVNKSVVRLSKDAVEKRLYKIVSALTSRQFSVSFDPLNNCVLVRAGCIHMCMVLLYFAMKLTEGLRFVDTILIEKLFRASISDIVIQKNLHEYISDYVQTFC